MSISKMRLNLSETLNHGNLIDIKEEKLLWKLYQR
jgi:hypothetical protein